MPTATQLAAAAQATPLSSALPGVAAADQLVPFQRMVPLPLACPRTAQQRAAAVQVTLLSAPLPCVATRSHRVPFQRSASFRSDLALLT